MTLKYLKEINEFLEEGSVVMESTGLYIVGKHDFNNLLLWVDKNSLVNKVHCLQKENVQLLEDIRAMKKEIEANTFVCTEHPNSNSYTSTMGKVCCVKCVMG